MAVRLSAPRAGTLYPQIFLLLTLGKNPDGAHGRVVRYVGILPPSSGIVSEQVTSSSDVWFVFRRCMVQILAGTMNILTEGFHDFSRPL
jgi:hypothetical protein